MNDVCKNWSVNFDSSTCSVSYELQDLSLAPEMTSLHTDTNSGRQTVCSLGADAACSAGSIASIGLSSCDDELVVESAVSDTKDDASAQHKGNEEFLDLQESKDEELQLKNDEELQLKKDEELQLKQDEELQLKKDVVKPVIENLVMLDEFDKFCISRCTKATPISESKKQGPWDPSESWKPRDLSGKVSRDLDVARCDVFFLHSMADYPLAAHIKNSLIEHMRKKNITVTVLLYGELESITEQFDRLECGMKRAAYTFILITDTFVSLDLDRYKANTLLCVTIADSDRRDTVIPLYIDQRQTILFAFRGLCGIVYNGASGKSVDNRLYYMRLEKLLSDQNPSLRALNATNEENLRQERQKWIVHKYRERTEELQRQQEQEKEEEKVLAAYQNIKREQMLRTSADSLNDCKNGDREILAPQFNSNIHKPSDSAGQQMVLNVTNLNVIYNSDVSVVPDSTPESSSDGPDAHYDRSHEPPDDGSVALAEFDPHFTITPK